jgi:large subunit ribosomal protein L21
VVAAILNHIKDDKKIVFKFKPKTGYKKKAGHRQLLTTIKVETVNG